MNDNTVFEEDSRTYVNPQLGLTETESFIDTLRDVQAKNTAQINQNTYNLGSPVASNVGGLGGSEHMWQAQYQTPQTDAQIANLRATAQANALNQVTQNLSDIYTNRYKQALRNYYARGKGSGSGDGTGGDEGDVEFVDSETVKTDLQQIPTTSKFYEIFNDESYIPGYGTGVSAIPGATEAERRANWIAQIIGNQQKVGN